ncbi:tripartite motif-containing protein 2-like [Branchiostoma floridae]|uniref:RING-type E3 ubiquitin transferase n=1 Tax=Branchiostoma floridae TaxID=7739 RepID=A0A9J7MLN6_BRAFL|nr:tripartite motif-containing protein 2-like [Branchiostoma floridae]
MASSKFSLEEFDDKLLTCPVCKGIYNNPRILPCLHTFCANCLEMWRKGEVQFTCPTCRQLVRLKGPDVSSFPSSFYINNLLDFRAVHHSNAKRLRASCGMCESDASIEGTCGDCKLLLCGNCLTGHGNSPALKDHYIIALHERKDSGSRSKFTRTQYCPQHADQRRTFYCQPCDKLVCQDCTTTEHQPGPNHDPQKVGFVAQKYKDELQTLVGKGLDTADVLKRTKVVVGKEVTTISVNCQIVKQEIKEHFAELRAKLDKEEQEVTEKLAKMEMRQKEPLTKEEQELEERLQSTEEELKFCTDILARGNDVEIITLRKQLGGRLDALSLSQIQHEALKNHVSFLPTVIISNSELSLTCKPLLITEPPIESLPTNVIFTPKEGQVLEINPQVTVMSSGGQYVELETTRTSEGAFQAVWRPQTLGQHEVGVTMEGEGSLCSSISIDVGTNNPVLKFGQEGSQQGQFNEPRDVAVSGDRLYVADTFNNRVQVFDLSGNFCRLIPIQSASPWSLSVLSDGTLMVYAEEDIVRLSQSGEELHSFSMEFCSSSGGLAVQRSGRIVATDRDDHCVLLFEADGTLVKKVGGQVKGESEGEFNEPFYVCVDRDDNIIVTDSNNCRVQVFDKDMNFRYQFGQEGFQPQDMSMPMGVTTDSRGNIVLANFAWDSNDDPYQTIQVYRSDGTWVSTISSNDDKMETPRGVAVTNDGHVFVSGGTDHCIRKYRYW